MSKKESRKISDFIKHNEEVTEVETKRFKLERYMIYIVFGISVLGLAFAAGNSTIVQTIISWFSPSGGHPPSILLVRALNGNNLSQDSTQLYPTFNNSFVRFYASFNDTDPYDWHSMVVFNGTVSNYIFNVSGLNFNFSCGNHLKLCSYSSSFVTDNPLFCDYNVAGYGDQTQNFTVYIIDNGNGVSNRSSIFAVDRPPMITGINVVRIN